MIPQAYDELPLQIEHIIARKHHGSDEPDNLALACFACNNHKGPNISGIDSGEMIRLFHPRFDRWDNHVLWEGGTLMGLTPLGRTTVEVLSINLPYRVDLREALITEGVFP